MPRVTGPKTSRFVLLASVCVVVAALYFAQAVLIPLALAMLLSFLMAPLVARLERWRIQRVPAGVIVVGAPLRAIPVVGYVVGAHGDDPAAHMEPDEGENLGKG